MGLFRAKTKKGQLCGKDLRVGAFFVKVGDAFQEGGYGLLYKATDVQTGQLFALKHVFIMGNPEVRDSILREVRVLDGLRGQPGIVRLFAHTLLGAGETESALLLMEFCPVTLVDLVTTTRVREHDKLRIFRAVTQGIAAMHAEEPPITHRDVKAENVLQRSDGSWCLCDFGSATDFSGMLSSRDLVSQQETQVLRMTTPLYRSPELWDLYLGQRINPKSDVWALGCLLYWLLTDGRSLPFEPARLPIASGRFSPPPAASPAAKSIVDAALAVELDRRPDAFTLLEMVDAAIRSPEARVRVPPTPSGTRPAPSALSQRPRQPASAGAPQANAVRETAQPAGREAAAARGSVQGAGGVQGRAGSASQAPAQLRGIGTPAGGSFWATEHSAASSLGSSAAGAGVRPPQAGAVQSGAVQSGSGPAVASSGRNNASSHPPETGWATFDSLHASNGNGVQRPPVGVPANVSGPGQAQTPGSSGSASAGARPAVRGGPGAVGASGMGSEIGTEQTVVVVGKGVALEAPLLGDMDAPVPLVTAPPPQPAAPALREESGMHRDTQRSQGAISMQDEGAAQVAASETARLTQTAPPRRPAAPLPSDNNGPSTPHWAPAPGRTRQAGASEGLADRVRGLTEAQRHELIARVVEEHRQLSAMMAEISQRLTQQGRLLATLTAAGGHADLAPGAEGLQEAHAGREGSSAVLPGERGHTDSGVMYDAQSGFSSYMPSESGGDEIVAIGMRSGTLISTEDGLEYMPVQTSPAPSRTTPTHALRSALAERRHRRARSDIPNERLVGGRQYQAF